MNQAYKKQVKTAFLIVFLFFLVAGVFLVIHFHKPKEVIDKEKIQVSFQSSDILTLKNTLPIADKLGMTLDGEGTEEGVQGYLEFSVKNLSDGVVDYDIALTRQDMSEKQISENYVKFFLTDMNDEAFDGFQGNLIPTFHDFSYISNKPSSKLLFSDSLSKKGEEKKYRLRVWLSDRYVISFDEEWFSVDVDVISK